MGRIGFIVAGCLSMVCTVFLGCGLADGSSIVTVKMESKLISDGITSSRYGFGYFQDSGRWQWREKDHFFEVAGCNVHQRLGNTIKAGALIGVCAAAFSVITSLLGTATGKGIFGILTLAFNALMFLGFLAAMSCGWALFDQTYGCSTYPAFFQFRVKHHFNLNYGLFFLIFGVLASLINMPLLVATGALSDDVADPTPNEPVNDEVGTEKVKESKVHA